MFGFGIPWQGFYSINIPIAKAKETLLQESLLFSMEMQLKARLIRS